MAKLENPSSPKRTKLAGPDASSSNLATEGEIVGSSSSDLGLGQVTEVSQRLSNPEVLQECEEWIDPQSSMLFIVGYHGRVDTIEVHLVGQIIYPGYCRNRQVVLITPY